jgi:uncharacterized protein (DUF2147 family)
MNFTTGKFFLAILFCVSFFTLVNASYSNNSNYSNNNLLGTWQTIDDVSGKPKAIIQIEENNDQTISGRIVKIFNTDNKNPSQLCLHCLGEKKNQPLIGMVIMESLKQSKESKNAWINGQILDPQNGKTYHCNIQLTENGQQLNVRGYIGLPLLGRTQTWIKN